MQKLMGVKVGGPCFLYWPIEQCILVIVLMNYAFHDFSDTSIKKKNNLRVKHTYTVSTIIIAVVVVVITMSPYRRVPFELCNTAIMEYYF